MDLTTRYLGLTLSYPIIASAPPPSRTSVDEVSAVRAVCSLPLAVRIGPFSTALPHFARRLVKARADSLVLFNRHYKPERPGYIDTIRSRAE